VVATTAQAIRELNHRTRGPDAFPGPAELYRLWREASEYHFAVRGMEVTLPRRCTDAPVDNPAWAAGFWFGGTSEAPHEITAQIQE